MASIRKRLALLFLTFFVLLSISAGATFWGLTAQAKDALVINLSGRQRMLVQQMTRLAIEMTSRDVRSELETTAATFNQTLQALHYGGQTDYLPGELVEVPASRDPLVLHQLNEVERIWNEYRQNLQTLGNNPPDSPEFIASLEKVQAISPRLVSAADAAVRLLQADSNRKVQFLRGVQIGFFGAAILLLVGAVYVTQQSVLIPLRKLGKAARRIGQGDLKSPVDFRGPSEIELLATTFERMRSELEASHKKLVDWGSTLEELVHQRTRELDALYEVSQEITSRLEVNHVLRSVTGKARELLNADVAFLCLLEKEDRVLSLQTWSGPEDAAKTALSSPDNPLIKEIQSRHCAWSLQGEPCNGICGIAAGQYTASHLAAPLWVNNRVIGALCVGCQRTAAFCSEDVDLLSKLAGAAAVALENARLYDQAERAATLEERQRIAAEMHDGLAQTLSYLGLMVDQAAEALEKGNWEQAEETLLRVRAGIDLGGNHVRKSIASLQEEPPPSLSLQQQLAKLVKEISPDDRHPVEWITELEGSLVLQNSETQLVLGIAREALVNALRHAYASQINLCLQVGESEAVLTVADNGTGFDPLIPKVDGRKHFGLNILKARAARLDGLLDIVSEPGKGTCISLRWPVKPHKPMRLTIDQNDLEQ